MSVELTRLIPSGVDPAILQCPEAGDTLQWEEGTPAHQLIRRATVGGANQGYASEASGWLVRTRDGARYPVVDGIPILLAPEAYGTHTPLAAVDLMDPKFEEAYAEMAHYNAVCAALRLDVESSAVFRDVIRPAMGISSIDRTTFPIPENRWLDADYELPAQHIAYAHLAERIPGGVVLQLGGSGVHAVKFLLAGAREAWLLSPMLEEIRYAQRVAEIAGVADRFRGVVGIGEALPFRSHVFDAIYSGGCLHHMRTEYAFPEIARSLKEQGRFAAAEPWRAPLYRFGTTVCGKRERSVYCRPLDDARMKPLAGAFASSRIMRSGILLRYVLLALHSVGLTLPRALIRTLLVSEDRFIGRTFLERFGSAVAITATVTPQKHRSAL